MPFAIKYVFTEEEMKNPIIAKYIQHRKDQLSYYHRKKREKILEKSDRFFEGLMNNKESENFKLLLKNRLFS